VRIIVAVFRYPKNVLLVAGGYKVDAVGAQLKPRVNDVLRYEPFLLDELLLDLFRRPIDVVTVEHVRRGNISEIEQTIGRPVQPDDTKQQQRPLVCNNDDFA